MVNGWFMCCCFPVADSNWVGLYWQDTSYRWLPPIKWSWHERWNPVPILGVGEAARPVSVMTPVYCVTLAKFISSFWVSVTSFLGWSDMDSIGMFWELNEILWFLATVLVLSHHLNVILLFPLSSALCPQYTPYYFPSCWSALPTTFFRFVWWMYPLKNGSSEKRLSWMCLYEMHLESVFTEQWEGSQPCRALLCYCPLVLVPW